MTDTNLVRFRAAVAGALAHLESRRQEVNDLNVFPVADGDTGDNMALTLRAVLAELDRLINAGDVEIDPADRDGDRRSRSPALRFSGRAELRRDPLAAHPRCRRGAREPSRRAHRPRCSSAPRSPTPPIARTRRCAGPAEGTILTVAREMAHEIMTDVAHRTENPRLGQDADRALQDEVIAATLERAVAAGQESVKRGPSCSPLLRDAGVVDAGGYALTILFAGVVGCAARRRAAAARSPCPGAHHPP